jgi:hypothetical protein
MYLWSEWPGAHASIGAAMGCSNYPKGNVAADFCHQLSHKRYAIPVIMAWPGLGSLQRADCPLWVKSGHSTVSKRCPLYPQKQTGAMHSPMSAKGHLFDHLVGSSE